MRGELAWVDKIPRCSRVDQRSDVQGLLGWTQEVKLNGKVGGWCRYEGNEGEEWGRRWGR